MPASARIRLTDMAWHTTTTHVDDPAELERRATESVAMFDEVEGCMFSPQFSHIFAGGYAAGYYNYKWAEVLDADAFSMFKRNGLFDKKTADSFRTNILMRGGTEHPMTLSTSGSEDRSLQSTHYFSATAYSLKSSHLCPSRFPLRKTEPYYAHISDIPCHRHGRRPCHRSLMGPWQGCGTTQRHSTCQSRS